MDTELQKIYNDKKKFKISIGIAIMHNISVIILTIMLFIAFSQYNLLLGIVWTFFRIGKGFILSYNDKNYWGLLNIAKKYSDSSSDEKNRLSDLTLTIIKTKKNRFSIAMTFWTIGTLAFSIVLIIYGVVPFLIGLFGIVGSISVGFGDGLKIVKPEFKVSKLLSSVSGLVALLFEIILGIWLLYYSFMI